MEPDNRSKQMEEVEALCSIYGSDWKTESDSHSYSISIKENKLEVLLCVTMSQGYPADAPPTYELSAPWMQRKAKENLYKALDEVYLDNIGETVIFQWIEKIREILQNIGQSESDAKDRLREQETHKLELDLSQINIKCPDITHGEVIIDRKSSFQGHAAVVKSIDEVNAVLFKLKQNKKFVNATHNMYAYRIERPTAKGTTTLQDCDDDGEVHAGGRMLHLLQILEQKNTLVVVSRWYGGIQLGPDRFRHINNAARNTLQKAGLLKH